MTRFLNDELSERLDTANKARQAMLERIRLQRSKDDPATIERKAIRLATNQAHESRVKAQAVAAKGREAEAAQLALDQLECEAAERRAEADHNLKLIATQKAARDSRYAARKARRR